MSNNRLMNWWLRLAARLGLTSPPQQSPLHAALIAAAEQVAQRASPLSQDDQTLSDTDILVFDLETSGLDVQNDTVLSIGAVTIQRNGIALGNVFHEVLSTSAELNLDSQLMHGITRQDLAAGAPPRTALLQFLEYSTDRIWTAYHAEFDRVMLQNSIREWLGVEFDPQPIDVAELAPLLFPDKQSAYSPLEYWLEIFGLTVRERHNALEDAMVTAELMLILLDRAHQQGYRTWGELNEACRAWRQVQRHLPGD